METTLFRRTVMDEIARYLRTDDIVVLHGARQVGKTSILMVLQRELAAQGERTMYLDLEDSRLVAVLDRGVEEFLRHLQEEGADLDGVRRASSKLFVLIDEIQYLANPSSFLKLVADHHRYLKLIVSGSSSFAMKSKFRDSLVGRTVDFEIHPLSFRELLHFRGVPFTPSDAFTEKKTLELQVLYAEYALYGGYPKIVLTPDLAMKERYLQQIIDTYVRKDIRDLAEIKDVTKFSRLLEVLASQSANLLNIAELSNTCTLARPTVERYLFLLEQTYIIRLVRPFSRNLRSELSKMPKVFLCDTGLMQMLWLKRLQREVLGPVFETSIYAELLKRYGAEQVGYWRTTDKKEIDFVIRFPEGPLPVEAKLDFPHATPPAIRSFLATEPETPGRSEAYRVVALYGKPVGKRMIYPWQLYTSP
jgi:predicted AAA+ superfamily ATPase